jgi:hypothetical protein
MKYTAILLFAAVLGATALSGCSNDPTVENNGTTTNGSNITFLQIARLGRPGLKELYLPYSTHDAFNRRSPIQDIAQTGPLVSTFVTGTGGRSAAIAQYVETLLDPDNLVANVTITNPTASYLGWETNGQIDDDCALNRGAVSTVQAGGSPAAHLFGGRGLDDDVVSAMLSLTFGNLATSSALTAATPNVGLHPPVDDGKEKNGLKGTPNLTNQLLGCAGKEFTTGPFPYLAAPI